MTLLVPGDQAPSNRNTLANYLPLLGYVALAFLVAATAYYFFWKIGSVIEKEKLRDLGAIADTKVEQITTWREFQKRTGESFLNSSLLADEFDQWQKEGTPPSVHKQHIQKLLSELQHANNYKAILLLDREGVVKVSTSNDYVPDTDEGRLASQAIGSRRAVFSDFHQDDSGGQGIYIDLIVPLTVSDKKNDRVAGAAVLVIDPYTFLYPLIQSWPGRRGSAETLLIKREGNEVLFLNELYYNKGAALSLHIPLSKPNLPSAMAIRGEKSTMDGTDYRGVAVVSVMREVPGTPWHMVVKVDKAELFAPVDQLKKWTIGLGLVVMLLGGSLLFTWLKGLQTRHNLITAQRDAALEREMLAKHFEYLTKYANDMILVADETGRIVEANERALEAYGYTREEFLQMKVSALRSLDEDPAIQRGQLAQLKERGELLYEAVNRRKDGTTFPIEVNIRVIEVQGTKYMHSITRDITVRKQAEDILRQSEEKFRTLVANLPQRIFVKDANSVYVACNANFAKDVEIDPDGIAGKTDYDFFPGEVADKYREEDNRVISSGQTESFEESYLLDGEKRFAYTTKAPFKDGQGKIVGVVGVYWDITDRKRAEQLLRQQKNFNYQVIDADPNLISVRDAAGKFLLANQAVATLYGMGPEELTGRNIAELFPDKEQANTMLHTDSEVIENRRQIEFVEHNFLSGMNRWFHVTKAPLEQPDGSVHVLDVTVDITESRLAAEKLLKSAEQIEDLYDNAPCGYHSLDKDGIIVRINNTELEWLGYTRNELIGQWNFLDLLTPFSSEKFCQRFQMFQKHGGVQELELDVLRKDGTVLPVLLISTAIYDPDGHFVMSRSTMFDITTRRLAENALRESENLFRTTVDNVPIIIWVADVDEGPAYLGCNFFNRRWHDFTGHAQEETLVRDWIIYVHPDDAERCLDAYNKAFRHIQPFKLEYRLRRHDGVYRWMLDSGAPRFTAGGDFSGYIGTCIDITEQKQFEKMRAQMEHIGRLNIAGEMASGLAHELSQPLTACNNYLAGCLHRMEENDWDREKLHKAVRLAHNQAERAGKIINHLKEMVRKQGSKRTLIDVNSLIRDVVTFLEDEVKRQGISIHMALFPLPQIMACKVEIEQVLLNLCKNAIESMHSCPQRELRVITCAVEPGEILVTVGDSGRGIPPDGIESLFNPFQTSKDEGLGLGLAICRSFVENHSGRIWADTQREFGAEFYFTLPVGIEHE